MRVVDLHPEDLIDKLSGGQLTAIERERLDGHLARCSSCRFEVSVRADLEENVAVRPQLASIRQAAQRSQISEQVSEVGEPAAPLMHAAGALIRRGRRHWPLVLLAASLLLCAGAAAAAVATGVVRAPAWLPWAPGTGPNAALAAAAKLVAQPKSGPKGAVAPSVAEPPTMLELGPERGPATRALANSARARPPTFGAARPHFDAATSAPAAPGPTVTSSAAPPANDGSLSSTGTEPARADLDAAASLFADANRARRDGNPDRAILLYRSLQARFPSSSESELSRALLAQLLLDRGSPEQALAGFDRYLSEGAPVLSAEASVGRARALEQLGRSEQAATAWRQVQSRFPGSVHARLAAARLAVLGTR